jgi:hypothetical protein
MLKIVRRLELRVVEQKCWRFLLSIVNQENCVHLHQIADFFECAPLKISAWRIIQESKPGYGAAPTHMISSMQVNASSGIASNRSGHGLTGPGEMDNLSSQQQGMDDEDSDDGDGNDFSIFTATTPTGMGGDQSDDGGNEGEGEGLLGSINKRYDHYVHPDKLPRGTPASQVVKAWSFRLQEVYADCCDNSGNGEDIMSIAEHAAAANRSDTESTQGDVTPAPYILQQMRPSLKPRPSTTQPRDEKKSPASVKFAEKQESEEESFDYDDENTNSINTPLDLDWKVELTNFYKANNLEEKIQSIDAILEAWHGREVDMMDVLHDKYKVHFDERLRRRLSQS